MYNFVELVQDDVRNRGTIVPYHGYGVPLNGTSNKEVYRSLYLFTEEYKEYSKKNKGVSGYNGVVSIDNIPFDFDGEDLTKVLDYCREFIAYLTSQFNIDSRRLEYFFSGAKGFHIYLPAQMFALEPSTKLPDEVKSVVKKINEGFKNYDVDLAIYDKTRIFRVANTINAKTGLYKIPLTYDEISTLKISEILELAKKPKTLNRLNMKHKPNLKLIALKTAPEAQEEPKPKKEYSTVPRGKLCYAKILQGVKEGNRDNCALRLATHLRKEGMPYETTVATMLKWNEKNQPPMSDAEVTRKTLSAYNVDYDFGCNDEILQQFCDENCILKRKKEEAKPQDINLESKILDYLAKVSSASSSSIEMAVIGSRVSGEDKIAFDSLLKSLEDRDKVKKLGRYEYQLVKEMEWIDTPFVEGVPIDFEMPYFNECSRFNWGDLLIIGSQNKYGKTTFAMNMIKRLVMQGIKPYYIYSETGGGFEETCAKLKLTHRDFYRLYCASPYNIVLKPKSVVIFDWVRPDDFARTDALFGNITDKLQKSKAILASLVQLKTDKEQADQFFAPNLIGQYPTVLARYLHNEESENGTKTYLDVPLIRRPKYKNRQATISTRFNWDDYTIRTTKEIEDEKISNNS